MGIPISWKVGGEKVIGTTKAGQQFLVDIDIYEKIKDRSVYSRSGDGYLAVRVDGKPVRLHRFIIGASVGTEVDHIDRDIFNNLRSNLRLCTHSQNQHNSARRSDNRSGYKGVCFDKSNGKWKAQIQVEGKVTHLGLFTTPEDAHKAYRKASDKYHKEFGRTE